MRYTLEYASSWTAYTAGFYATVEDCERDCSTRYRAAVHFEKNDTGVLQALVFAEDTVVLRLHDTEAEDSHYEAKTAHYR